MKDFFARLLLRWELSRFLRDEDPFHRFLGQAVRLQLGRIPEDELRRHLDDFYAHLNRPALMRALDFDAKASQLDRPGGYKVNVMGQREDSASRWRRYTVWGRRFALLRRLGVRSDVLILREGEQVPPHGHTRVVSGFYLLEGEVAVRHFDRIREEKGGVLVRPTLDAVLGPGEYTTNSEYHHNIHWLRGLAPASYLFRVTVAGTPAVPFAAAPSASERLYLDPTGVADDDGLILAPYVSEERAKALCFEPCRAGAGR